MANAPFSAQGAAQKLKSRKTIANAAVSAAVGKTTPKKKAPPRGKKGTTYASAKRTKHKGSEGETAYGQKMTESPIKRKKK